MIRLSRSLSLAAAIVSFGGVLTIAQAPSDAKPATATNSASSTSQEESAAMELQSLIKALSGKWNLNVKFEPTGGMPTAITGIGEESWREGPGGFTIIEDEHLQKTPYGQLYLLAVIWWDSRAKKFQGMECNNNLPFTCDLKGALTDITITWDEKTLAIDELETHNGKKTIWHEAWSKITPTSFTQTGSVTQPDGSTSNFMTIQGTRANDRTK